jgi:hypothetical protein
MLFLDQVYISAVNEMIFMAKALMFPAFFRVVLMDDMQV